VHQPELLHEVLRLGVVRRQRTPILAAWHLHTAAERCFGGSILDEQRIRSRAMVAGEERQIIGAALERERHVAQVTAGRELQRHGCVGLVADGHGGGGE